MSGGHRAVDAVVGSGHGSDGALPSSTSLQRGTAQPAYGQPGGGVEVIFTAGSPDQTVTLPPDNIPP